MILLLSACGVITSIWKLLGGLLLWVTMSNQKPNTTFCVCVIIMSEPTKRRAKHYHQTPKHHGRCRWNRSRCNDQWFSFLCGNTSTWLYLCFCCCLHRTSLKLSPTLITYLHVYNQQLLFVSLCPLQHNIRQDAWCLRRDSSVSLLDMVATCEEYIRRLRSLAVEVLKIIFISYIVSTTIELNG